MDQNTKVRDLIEMRLEIVTKKLSNLIELRKRILACHTAGFNKKESTQPTLWLPRSFFSWAVTTHCLAISSGDLLNKNQPGVVELATSNTWPVLLDCFAGSPNARN
jgi:hypothetical protein